MHDPEASQRIQVVLVDDEPRIHESVQDILQKAGYIDRLESFYDPISFLEHLKQRSRAPDIILLDVHFDNSGLSGVDIIPFIREDHPYLPVMLLTGMEGTVIEDAQDFDCVYFIPKPVSPEHLVRMLRFYLGAGQKRGQRSADMSRELSQYKDLVRLLKKEIAQAEIAAWDQGKPAAPGRDGRAFQRVIEILGGVLKGSELSTSFADDMQKLFSADFKLFKKAVETLIRFDLTDFSSPGLDIHRYQCAQHVYSLRLTKKARLFFFQSELSDKKRLLRLDPGHDSRAMEKWLRDNYESYAG